jgi:phosphoribosylformylglycinamidine synthase
MTGGLGVSVLMRYDQFAQLPPSAVLFGEAQSRVVVSLSSERAMGQFEKMAEQFGVTAQWIGTVGGDRLRVTIDGQLLLDEAVEEMKAKHEGSITSLMTAKGA